MKDRFGTGPGLVAAAAMKRGASAIGIDFSEAMLEEAQQRYRNIEFRQASADSLPFEDAAFDAVVSNFVVHHLGRPEKALEEMFRILRKDGRVGFTFRDWAGMDAFPASLQTAIESSVRNKAKAYESEGMLIIPNPAILVSAVK